jgi:ABC-type dipeptide/oligopeptide/nickel transport system permease component
MLVFLARRALQLFPVIFGVSVIVFLMIHLIPGDPAQIIAGQDATQEDIQAVRVSLGLDRPLVVQYLSFIGHALTGDFGESFRTGRPVIEEISVRYGNTLLLGLLAMAFGTVVGVIIGAVTAVYRGTWVDNLVLGVSLFGISTPAFFLGILLMLVFSVWLQWLPLTGMGSWRNFIMPALALGIPNAAVVARMARTSLIEVLQQDYIRTAQAKGVSGSAIVMRHALRNALIPVITVVGLQMGYLLGGAIVTETVFAWPGIGRLVIQSISTRDFPMVQAAVLVLALTFVIITLITDILYWFVDPRMEIN